jgi:hypothetical protein
MKRLVIGYSSSAFIARPTTKAEEGCSGTFAVSADFFGERAMNRIARKVTQTKRPARTPAFEAIWKNYSEEFSKSLCRSARC